MQIRHQHPARVVRWRDADTVLLDVHLDYGLVSTPARPYVHRLTWIQAPEKKDPGFAESVVRVNELAPPGSLVMVETYSLDGDPDGWYRWLANIYCEAGSVSEILLKEGVAEPYVRKSS